MKSAIAVPGPCRLCAWQPNYVQANRGSMKGRTTGRTTAAQALLRASAGAEKFRQAYDATTTFDKASLDTHHPAHPTSPKWRRRGVDDVRGALYAAGLSFLPQQEPAGRRC